MTDERYTFESTRVRLDEILVAVRKKDTSLEQSLELLEEGVRLANMCNELIDQTSWKAPDAAEADGAEGAASDAPVEAGVEAGPPADEERDDTVEGETGESADTAAAAGEDAEEDEPADGPGIEDDERD